MTAISAEQANDIEVPRWVPPELQRSYREIAADRGEEEAAAWARAEKSGEAKPVDRPGSVAVDRDETFAWTEERIDRLRRMVADGMTRPAIAEALGTTKNSVTGKIDRLGLRSNLAKVDRGPASEATRPKVARAQPSAPAIAPRPAAKPSVPVPIQPVVQRLVVPASPVRRVLIEELTDKTCRWPFGDRPPFEYCGAPTEDPGDPKRVYCREHSRLAGQPAIGRRPRG